MSPNDPIEALLFDLGGVVIDIDPMRMLRRWAPLSALSVEQMRDRLAADEPFRRHECGELDARGYFAHLRRVLVLDGDDAAVAEGWNAMLVGEIPAALRLVERVGDRMPCFAFTNTSASHKAVWSTRFPRVVTAFERIFASHELGMRKPDTAAFRHVVEAIGTRPAQTLFFDDSAENVRGAQRAGLRAVHVTETADIARALAEHGLV